MKIKDLFLKILLWYIMFILIYAVTLRLIKWKNKRVLKNDKNYEILEANKDKFIYTNAYKFMDGDNPNNEFKIIRFGAIDSLFNPVINEIYNKKALLYLKRPLIKSKEYNILLRRLKIAGKRMNFYITSKSIVLTNDLYDTLNFNRTFLTEFIYDTLRLPYRDLWVVTNDKSCVNQLGVRKVMDVDTFRVKGSDLKQPVFASFNFSYYTPWQSINELKIAKRKTYTKKDYIKRRFEDGYCLYPKDFYYNPTELIKFLSKYFNNKNNKKKTIIFTNILLPKLYKCKKFKFIYARNYKLTLYKKLISKKLNIAFLYDTTYLNYKLHQIISIDSVNFNSLVNYKTIKLYYNEKK